MLWLTAIARSAGVSVLHILFTYVHKVRHRLAYGLELIRIETKSSFLLDTMLELKFTSVYGQLRRSYTREI